MDVMEFVTEETLKVRPDLSGEEIIHLSAEYIENNLPQIVKEALPDIDLIIRKEKLKLQLTRRSHRWREGRKILERLEFLDALSKIKELSNGKQISDESSSSAYVYGIYPEDNLHTTVSRPVSYAESVESTFVEKIVTGKYTDHISKEFLMEGGTLKKYEPLKLLEDARSVESLESLLQIEKITEDARVLIRKTTDENFGITIDKVKRVIEELPELRGEDFSAEIYIEHDTELLGWEQTIIKFKIEEKGFDEKMKLWDEIDRKVRMVIKEIKSDFMKDGKDHSYLDEINKNLFIDVEF